MAAKALDESDNRPANPPKHQAKAKHNRQRRLVQQAACTRVDVGERRALTQQEDRRCEEKNQHALLM